MNIALCYESVLPARGGCETYIGDLSRRLAKDGHEVHLYACRWDNRALPPSMIYHKLEVPAGPRFLRPWRFGKAVEVALKQCHHDVSIGFDKTWGQDILYPQGGLHVASRAHNRLKYPSEFVRVLADLGKRFDPAAWSFAKLERKQYLSELRPLVLVNSFMVQTHFADYYGLGADRVQVLRSAIDPDRFAAADRVARRQAERTRWGVAEGEAVGLFVAMNYRLKGLAPLLHAVAVVPKEMQFRIVIVGHPKFSPYAMLAKRLGIHERVLFLGHRDDPKDAYFAADFLVHPTFYDPCSLVALEALACGLPVITTQFNGASELLNGENGLVVRNPHDAGELGAALQRMLNSEYRANASRLAAQTASEWTFEHHYRKFLEFAQEVARQKQGERPTFAGR